MAKIALYLSLLTIILPNIISAHFPGDGCCIRWDRDGICCMNIQGQCCGDRGFGKNFGFRHHDGSRRGPDDRFDGRRGDLGRDRSGFGNSFGRDDRKSGFDLNGGDRSPNNRDGFKNRPNDRQEVDHQENGRFDGNDRQGGEGNNRQGHQGSNRQGIEGNNRHGSVGNNRQGAEGNSRQGSEGNNRQGTEGNNRQGGRGALKKKRCPTKPFLC